MKKDIHPQLNKVIFKDVSTGVEYIGESTVTSNETKTVDGIEYYVLNIQISSSSHPFYTGKYRIVDTENLVKRFENKAKKAESLSDKLKASKIKQEARKKKTSVLSESKSLTLKDMLNQMK